jgi:hypothetical protein
MLYDVAMVQRGRGDISRVRKGTVSKLFTKDLAE